jgi:hypothetical protein
VRTAVVLLLWLSLVGLARGDGEGLEARAFVEVVSPRAAYFVGEPFRVVLHVGLDREHFERNAVPIFRRPMDVPVHVEAPWVEELPGATRFEEVAAPSGDDETGRLRLAVGDRAASAVRVEDRTIGGRAFTVLAVERRFVASAPGSLVLSAPRLRYAHAERFEEDSLGGRVPVDPRDVVVSGEALSLRIDPVPEEGRPAEFRGAVGRFSVRAHAEPTRVEVGEVFRLTLRVEGDGDLAALGPERLDLAGFHVYGAIESRAPGVRTVVHDVAALHADVPQVPSIPFAFLDPGPPARYRVERTAPVPLDVRPAPGGARGPAAKVETEAGPALPWGILGGVLALVAVAAGAAFVVRRRSRARALADPETLRVREAAAEFRALAARPGADLSEGLVAFLSAALACPPGAVVGPGLAGRLVAAGVPLDLADRAAATLDRLVAGRYGGTSSVRADEALALVGALEASLAAAARTASHEPT